MIRIRLKRMGRKKQPHYRVVVCKSDARREGAPIEELGYYDPRHKTLSLDKAKALDWIKKGASPSETVKGLINDCGDNGAFTSEAIERRKSRKAEIKAAKKAKESKETSAA